MAKKKENNSDLDGLISELNKDFGEGSVMRMSDPSNNVETFSSGSLALDVALGGGFAVGKVIEIFSDNMCGKSGRALEAIREVQALGREVLYLDYENALNLEYASQLGVDIDSMYISQPLFAEMGFEVAKKFIKSSKVGLIVFDSTNSMTPKAELEGESGQAFMANGARLFSQAMKQLVGIANDNRCTLMFISQTREKLNSYIPTKSVGVGRSVAYSASQRIDIRKSNITKDKDVVGFIQKNKVIKNKVAPPFKVGEVTIMFESGVDKEKELLDVASSLHIVERKGAWYAYSGTNIGQGIDKSADILRDNIELCEEIEQKIKEKLAE